MPPNRFESEVESFLEGSHGDRTHIKRADHHTVTPLCGTLLPTGTAARPHHRPRAPQPGPSSSSGALHTSGAWSLIGASSRSPARPRAPAAEPTPNFACNSVVTLKPTAPLLTTFGRFERVSRSQRRCRFHSAAHIRSQRCHRFHSDSLRCPRTRQNSPSTARIHPRTRQNGTIGHERGA